MAMETGSVTLSVSQRAAFLELLRAKTIPWDKRPSVARGKVACKIENESFSLQWDWGHAPRPIVTGSIQSGDTLVISWREQPQRWMMFYFMGWCAFLWFLILSRDHEGALPYAAGCGITALGFGVVKLNDMWAHTYAASLSDFIRETAAECAAKTPTPKNPLQ